MRLYSPSDKASTESLKHVKYVKCDEEKNKTMKSRYKKKPNRFITAKTIRTSSLSVDYAR